MFGPPATDTPADDRASVPGSLGLLVVFVAALLAMSHPWSVAAGIAALGLGLLCYRSRHRIADAAATATTDRPQTGPDGNGVPESD